MTTIPLVDLASVDLASLYDPDGWRSTPSRGLPGGRVKVRKAYGWDGYGDTWERKPPERRRNVRELSPFEDPYELGR